MEPDLAECRVGRRRVLHSRVEEIGGRPAQHHDRPADARKPRPAPPATCPREATRGSDGPHRQRPYIRVAAWPRGMTAVVAHRVPCPLDRAPTDSLKSPSFHADFTPRSRSRTAAPSSLDSVRDGHWRPEPPGRSHQEAGPGAAAKAVLPPYSQLEKRGAQHEIYSALETSAGNSRPAAPKDPTKICERWLTTAMLLAAGWAPANAATVVVNTLADPGSPGVCALRDAITAANTDAAVNGCSAGSGADTITFGVPERSRFRRPTTIPSSSCPIHSPHPSPPSLPPPPLPSPSPPPPPPLSSFSLPPPPSPPPYPLPPSLLLPPSLSSPPSSPPLPLTDMTIDGGNAVTINGGAAALMFYVQTNVSLTVRDCHHQWGWNRQRHRRQRWHRQLWKSDGQQHHLLQ